MRRRLAVSLDQLRLDLSFAIRSLRHSPGFALTAIAVLALGIAVNLAEIHLLEAVRHPLQVRDADSLAQFFRFNKEVSAATFSLPSIDFYRRQNTVLSAVISETDVQEVLHEDDSERLRCSLVSGNFFAEIGVAPLSGRLLDERDDRAGAAPVAVLGYGYWQRRFGGDPAIITKTIRLNNRPVEVVGIAPPEFGGVAFQPTPVWLSLSQYAYLTQDSRAPVDYAAQQTFMFGRLKPTTSFEAAEAQFNSLSVELRNQQPAHFDRNELIRVQRADAPSVLRPGVSLLFTICIALVSLVLLSACANLGNMLLARGIDRQQEIEIRMALGAGRQRLIRQLMTENLVLAATGSVAALFVGWFAARIFVLIADAPHLQIETDWKIVLVCAGLGMVSTIVFGLAPVLQTVRRGPKATRARQVLVSIQVAVSCVLLILSSLFVRGIEPTFNTQVSFDYAQMIVVNPAFHLHNYKPEQAREATLEIVERIRQLPGVDAAAITTFPPLTRRLWLEYVSGHQLKLNAVEASYFQLMRLPLLQGRVFEWDEKEAVVISESAARKLWPNQTPLGKSVVLEQRVRTVIGVVRDSGANLIVNPQSVEAYVPIEGRNAAAAMAPTLRALRIEPASAVKYE